MFDAASEFGLELAMCSLDNCDELLALDDRKKRESGDMGDKSSRPKCTGARTGARSNNVTNRKNTEKMRGYSAGSKLAMYFIHSFL